MSFHITHRGILNKTNQKTFHRLHHITSMPEYNPNTGTILDVRCNTRSLSCGKCNFKDWNQNDQLTESRSMTAMTGESVDRESFYDRYDWWISWPRVVLWPLWLVDQLTESRSMTAMTGGSVDRESFYDRYDWWISWPRVVLWPLWLVDSHPMIGSVN